MKRLVCLILCLVLLLSCIPMAAAAGPGYDNFKKVANYKKGTFKDVDEDAWYAFNVEKAYTLGLVKGITKTRFAPEGNITIAQTVALAARLHSIYHGSGGDFKQGDPWYQVYFDYCVNNKILTAGQFDQVDKAATRAEFASILAKSLPEEYLYPINNVPIGKIPDVAGTESYGPAVYLLYNAGVLTGSDKYGTFHPNSTIVRSEVSAIVTRMAATGLRKEIKLKEKPAPAIAPLPPAKTFSEIRTAYSAATDALKSAGRTASEKFEYAYLEVVAASGCTDIKADLQTCINQMQKVRDLSAGYSELSSLHTKAKEICNVLGPVLNAGKDDTVYARFFHQAKTAIDEANAITNAMTKEINRVVVLMS